MKHLVEDYPPRCLSPDAFLLETVLRLMLLTVLKVTENINLWTGGGRKRWQVTSFG